ncbi:MAG: hypothetical protein RDU25_01740 [Patescibacteria group bacterium]|nr:hypothetical protein [Patescibacteria group bacterium]
MILSSSGRSRRQIDPRDIIGAWLTISIAVPAIASLIKDQKLPSLPEIFFGFASFLFFSLLLAIFFSLFVGRMSWEKTSVIVTRIAWFSGALSLAAYVAGFWNDGSSHFFLLTKDVWLSIMSFGFYPLHVGPEAFIRFLPLALALGLAWSLWREKAGWSRALISGLAAYIVSALMLHAITWIGVSVSLTRGSSTSSLEDLYRLLVSRQSGGYWLNNQGERFFASMGMQAETALAAARASVYFISSCAVALAIALAGQRSRSLMRRILTREYLLGAVVLVGSAAAGVNARIVDSSFANPLSILAAAGVAFGVLGLWRLDLDLENLQDDEKNNPDFPLPSGLISLQEAQALKFFLSWFVVLGALILGWPVILLLAAAFASRWFIAAYGSALGRRIYFKLAGDAMFLLFAGSAAMLFGIRTVPYVAHLKLHVLALVYFAVLAINFSVVRRLSHGKSVVLASALIFAGSLIAGQAVWWGVGFIAVFAELACLKSPSWAEKYGVLPIIAAPVVVSFILLSWRGALVAF